MCKTTKTWLEKGWACKYNNHKERQKQSDYIFALWQCTMIWKAWHVEMWPCACTWWKRNRKTLTRKSRLHRLLKVGSCHSAEVNCSQWREWEGWCCASLLSEFQLRVSEHTNRHTRTSTQTHSLFPSCATQVCNRVFAFSWVSCFSGMLSIEPAL